MAWHNDIENMVHQHVKPYDKAAMLAHSITAIAWDVVNRQTGQLNRLDEVVDEATARAEAAEAEIVRLRGILATFDHCAACQSDFAPAQLSGVCERCYEKYLA